MQIGFNNIRHAQGVASKVPVYVADIALPNSIRIIGLPVTLVDLGADIDILVGMDIISMGDFAITSPDGKTKFSFKYPASADIDFAREIDAANARRSRNR